MAWCARAQEDIESYMKKEGNAESALEKLQRLYNAFKFIEQRLTQKKAKLKIKLPEITKTYNALVQMEEQSKLGEALTTHYELAQSVFAKAKISVHENDKARRRHRPSRYTRPPRRCVPRSRSAVPQADGSASVHARVCTRAHPRASAPSPPLPALTRTTAVAAAASIAIAATAAATTGTDSAPRRPPRRRRCACGWART